MEPLAALSLAGTVVQFVDFGTKVFTQTLVLIHRRKLDELNGVAEIEMISSSLDDICSKLSQPLLSVAPQAAEAGEQQEPLIRICQASQALVHEIIGELERLKVEGKHRKWKCFKEAIRWAWKEDALQNILRRLSALREMIETHVLITIRDGLDLVSLKQSKRFDRLDLETQHIVSALTRSQAELSAKLGAERQNIQQNLSTELKDQTHAISQMMSRLEATFIVAEEADTERKIRGKKFPRTLHDFDSRPIHHVGGSLKDQVKLIWEDEDWVRDQVGKAILEDLEFPTMTDREEEISDTHPETFRWIFLNSPPKDNEPLWSNFASWLEHGKGIYWINGKAASGKSTLMRYICQHKQTIELLKPWAYPNKPTLAEFFFWNSGTLEQRTQVGLLRTILFKVLQCHPLLVPVLFPAQYSRRYTQISAGMEFSKNMTREPWTLKRLIFLFERLFAQREVELKLCLFIDGLDEYDGCYEEMVNLFRSVVSSSKFKVCLSSRPLIAFEDAFGAGDSLRLQDLTYKDIQTYVNIELSKHPRYRSLLEDEPDRAPELVDEIVGRANGVFLWVKLVVQSLRTGLGNRDGLKDLQRRLRLLPADLEKLYSHMISNIDEFYKPQASQYLQLVHIARLQNREIRHDYDNSEPLTLIELSLADDEDDDLAVTASRKAPSRRSIEKRCEVTIARLHVRCLGLLEVHRSHNGREDQVGEFNRIQYLHRTTRDYLERPDVWPNILALTKNTDFDPHLSLLRACVLQIKWGLYRSVSSQYVFDLAVSHAKKIERDSGQTHVALLEQLFLTSRNMTYANAGRSYFQLASENELKVYLTAKRKSLLELCGDRTPLKYILFETHNRDFATESEAVKLLLQHGADPNEQLGRGTTWEKLLSSTYLEQNTINKDERFRTLQILFRSGADPDAKVMVGENEMAIGALCTQIFGKDSLEMPRIKRLKTREIVAVSPSANSNTIQSPEHCLKPQKKAWPDHKPHFFGRFTKSFKILWPPQTKPTDAELLAKLKQSV